MFQFSFINQQRNSAMSAILIESYDAPGDGPTVAVKDCIDIAGSATCCGSRALADVAPARDHARVVQALVDGGYRIVAKANMHELAYGMTGLNKWTGPVENPLFPALMPGGSSSGSAAAVAARMVDLALGTDTGGSVRMPAACCGVIGLKPSYGRLSRVGVMPAKSALDSVGIFGREMSVVEHAMAQMDPSFLRLETVGPVSIGAVDVVAAREIAAAVEAALASSGAGIESCRLPAIEDAFQAGVIQMAAEASAAYGHLVASGLLGEDVEQRLRGAPAMATVERLAWAEGVKAAFVAQVDALLDRFAVLALPTLPDFPPRIDDLGDAKAILRLSSLVRPFNLSGHPAISLPLATPSGRPAAIQLVGRRGDDARLCAIARIFADAGSLLQHKEQI
ncbi:Glu-tRNA amidotransferase [Sphingobium cupriresistens LL01]|uniref:Glu-tRNA amidotransferase n=2 Tax=Sphingobium cupriresistens TaxID=1132417 RepID=A0A0J7XJA4_9SPHN|nr:Glu-tRNA amidotransferase [Sphingobium cupriresistens LL01]